MQSSKLYVGNLNYSVNLEQLRELFSAYGEVRNVNIIEGRGFGFVEMGSSEQASKAMQELNGKDFEGRTLKIDEARPPKKRDQRDSGGFRGRRR